jgi:hypothetical protein
MHAPDSLLLMLLSEETERDWGLRGERVEGRDVQSERV